MIMAVIVAAMGFADLVVAMAPQHQLFQQEKQQDAAQQGIGNRFDVPAQFDGFRQGFQQGGTQQGIGYRFDVPAQFDGFRQDFQQGGTQQGANCIAHQHRHPTVAGGGGQ